MQKFKKALEAEDFLPDSRLVIYDYHCTLCKGIYRHPTVEDCGHVFCKECITKYLETSPNCPISNNPLDKTKIYPIKFIANILDKQSVYCKKRKLQCTWIGKLGELDDHLANECQKNIIKCRNPDCKKEIMREEEESHFLVCEHKKIPCKDCSMEILLKDQNFHSKVCLKFKIECPQNCGDVIERGKMEFHVKNLCENSVIQCIYHVQGCKENIIKKNLNQHLGDFYEKHQFLIFKVFDDFDNMFKVRMNSLETMYDKFSKKITNLENLIKENKEYLEKKKTYAKKEDKMQQIVNAKFLEKPIEKIADKIIEKPEKPHKQKQQHNIEGAKIKILNQNNVERFLQIKDRERENNPHKHEMEASKERILMGMKRQRHQSPTTSIQSSSSSPEERKNKYYQPVKIVKAAKILKSQIANNQAMTISTIVNKIPPQLTPNTKKPNPIQIQNTREEKSPKHIKEPKIAKSIPKLAFQPTIRGKYLNLNF
jgi:hypothetical protein